MHTGYQRSKKKTVFVEASGLRKYFDVEIFACNRHSNSKYLDQEIFTLNPQNIFVVLNFHGDIRSAKLGKLVSQLRLNSL